MSNEPVGIFNYANSYRQAAFALRSAHAKGTHPNAPVRFLMNHAIELYFKAFLNAKGISTYELSKKLYGHRLLELAWVSKQRGLCLSEQTYAVARTLERLRTQTTARYLETGRYRPIREDALDRACIELHQKVGKALKSLGYTIRI